MADGKPKDYSMVEQQPKLDGCFVPRRHRESMAIDLKEVVKKLEPVAINQHAMKTLSKHYSAVFNKKGVDNNNNQNIPRPQPEYRVYIQYHDMKDTFIVKVQNNSLRDIYNRMPKRGNYRLFFKNLRGTCEEFEEGDSLVPYHIKEDGTRHIYCQAFLC